MSHNTSTYLSFWLLLFPDWTHYMVGYVFWRNSLGRRCVPSYNSCTLISTLVKFRAAYVSCCITCKRECPDCGTPYLSLTYLSLCKAKLKMPFLTMLLVEVIWLKHINYWTVTTTWIHLPFILLAIQLLLGATSLSYLKCDRGCLLCMIISPTECVWSDCSIRVFYNLLIVLLEYIDPTMYFPHFLQIMSRKQFNLACLL